MKVMFISDLHGDLENLKIIKKIYDEENVSKIIVLGDIHGFYDDNEIDDILESFYDLVLLRGNCDSELDVMTSRIPFYDYYYDDLFGKKFFCTHGNRYNIMNFPDKDFDVMVYGHTHVGMIEKYDNKLILNPGSISRPRGGSERSFLLIDEKGVFLKDLDNNTIDKLNW